jgi:hypothetical protein
MNNILEFFKSEIDRDRKIGHLSYFLIFRPISFLFTILFILLKINAKKITFFRLIFLIFTYLYCITIDLNYYYVIFLNLFTVKILDSLKGKLFENLVDYLAFLYPLTIYLYNLRINNYFYNQEVDFLLTIFLIISYYFPTYLRNRIEILSNFEKNSNKTSIEKKFSKTNKNLKEYYELIHSLILLFLIALIVSELFQYALMILFLFRVFPFFSVFKSYKIFN